MGPATLNRQTAEAAAPSELELRARALVEALDRDDGEAAADALALLAEHDAESLRGRLGRLAEVLHRRVAELPQGMTPDLSGTDDAVHSLDHVARITEDAAHRCLDLVEEGRGLLSHLEDTVPGDVAAMADMRRIFNELALAQGYQDLSGQILKRVKSLLQGIETSLSRLATGDDDRLRPSGPAVPGVDRAGSSQSDADDLLAELGI